MQSDDSRLIAAISLIVHDLKSPLAGIQGNAQYLGRTKQLDDDAREAVSDILEGIRAMDRLVLNLLDVCRNEEGELKPRLRHVLFRPMAEQVVRELGFPAARRGQQIVLDVADDIAVQADEDLLRRIIENLVGNAVKYSRRGGTIRIGAGSLGSEVELTVRDTGDVIPESQRDRIFEGGLRLDRDSLTQIGASRGLGLAFCRAAVAAHGGTISAEEAEPPGNLFRVRLKAPTAERLPSPVDSSAEGL